MVQHSTLDDEPNPAESRG